MSREDEVNATVTQLIDAVKGGREEEAMLTAVIFIGGLACDLGRIADAVSKLAAYEVSMVDTALEEGPSGLTTLMGLSKEEADTIEALRRGDIVVNLVPGRGATPVPQWIEWAGYDARGPQVPANTLVDVRFREPSHGDRVADLIGVSPVLVSWLNTGRPTNADVVGWRISQTQADPAVAEVYALADPSTVTDYDGSWITWKPGDYKPNNHPVDLMPGHAHAAPRRVDLQLLNERVYLNIDPDAFDWNWYPVLGGNVGNAPTDIIAWRPAQNN